MMLKTTCPLDCFDSCSVLVDENGKLRGDKEHPITKGYLCPNLNNFHKINRIQKSRFQGKDISLEEALDILKGKLQEASAKKVLYFKGSGNLASLQSITKKFFSSFGASIAKGSLCEEAGSAGINAGRGVDLVYSPLHVKKSEVVVLWGRNPSTTNSHILPALKGKKLVVIDPVKIPLANKAELFIQIKPRGDLYLALLLTRLAYMQELEDTNFIKNRSENFEFFIDFVNSHPIVSLEEKSGVSITQAHALLDLIAGKKVSFLLGTGLQRYSFGHSVLRAIDGFIAMMGFFGKEGSGAGYVADSSHGYVSLFSAKKNAVVLPTVDFGLFDVVFIQGANPANQMPCTPKVKEGLQKAKCTVYFGLYENETSKLADLVIPAKTFLEKEDLKLAYGHNFVGHLPIVKQSDIGMSEYDLCAFLNDAFGFEKLKTSKEYIDEIVASNSFEEDGRIKSNADKVHPYSDKFYTPSGKFEFFDEYDDDFEDDGMFYLLAAKNNTSLNSQFQTDQYLYVPISLGLRDKMEVELSRGEFTCKYLVKVDERLRDDSLLLYSGNIHSNMLTPHKVSQEGDCAVIQDKKVNLRVVDG